MTGVEVRDAHDEELDAAGELVARAYLALGTPDGKDAEYGEYLDHVRDARGRAGTARSWWRWTPTAPSSAP